MSSFANPTSSQAVPSLSARSRGRGLYRALNAKLLLIEKGEKLNEKLLLIEEEDSLNEKLLFIEEAKTKRKAPRDRGGRKTR